eukprot:358767-Chlamydomonas_euryale.AAC.1
MYGCGCHPRSSSQRDQGLVCALRRHCLPLQPSKQHAVQHAPKPLQRVTTHARRPVPPTSLILLSPCPGTDAY